MQAEISILYLILIKYTLYALHYNICFIFYVLVAILGILHFPWQSLRDKAIEHISDLQVFQYQLLDTHEYCNWLRAHSPLWYQCFIISSGLWPLLMSLQTLTKVYSGPISNLSFTINSIGPAHCSYILSICQPSSGYVSVQIIRNFHGCHNK